MCVEQSMSCLGECCGALLSGGVSHIVPIVIHTYKGCISIIIMWQLKRPMLDCSLLVYYETDSVITSQFKTGLTFADCR